MWRGGSRCSLRRGRMNGSGDVLRRCPGCVHGDIDQRIEGGNVLLGLWRTCAVRLRLRISADAWSDGRWDKGTSP